MAIRFCLRDLPGGGVPGSEKKCAKVVLQGRCGPAEFLQRMRERGCRLLPAEIGVVLELAAETAIEVCREGLSAEIPHLGAVIPTVTGSVDTRGRWLAGPKIGLRFRFNTEVLRRVRGSEKPVLVQKPESGPRIERVEGLPDRGIVPGGMVVISGRQLRFNRGKSDEGVRFVRYDGVRVESFPVTELLENRPTRILCGVPEGLPPGGVYSVLVATRGQGKRLREAVCEVSMNAGKEVMG